MSWREAYNLRNTVISKNNYMVGLYIALIITMIVFAGVSYFIVSSHIYRLRVQGDKSDVVIHTFRMLYLGIFGTVIVVILFNYI